MNTEPVWHLATPEDEALVLRLMSEFYREDKIAFHEERIRAGLAQAFADPRLGRVFLLKRPGGGKDDALGYMVCTFCFSLEYGGRFLLLDELYLSEALRGQGWGRRSLDFALALAREEGLCAVRLEVNEHNQKAKAIYLKYGFMDERRGIMTKLAGA